MAQTSESRTSLKGFPLEWLWEIVSGRLAAPHVIVDNGSGVAITSFGGSGGTAMTDDAGYTVAVSSFTPVGGTYRSVLDSVDDNDGGAFAMTAKRALMAMLVDVNGDAVSVGGGTQYTEDAVAAANPVGTALNLVRADALAALTTTDGDNVAARGTDKGELYVKHADTLTVASHAVTNAGTFAVQAALAAGANNIGDVDVLTLPALPAGTNNIGDVDVLTMPTVVVTLAAGAAAIAKAEDAASADLDVGVPAMAVRKATPANTSGLDGDYEFLQISAGRLWASATIDAALPAGTNAIGKLAANSGVDIGDVDILSIAAGDNNIGNVDIVTLPAVTNAGTFAVQESGAGLTALQLIDNIVNTVDVALGATPVGVLGLAIRDDALSALTPVEGDAIGLRTDANGALWVIPSGTVAISAASLPSHAVTNAGTFATQIDGAALTALQLLDDTVIADDAAFVVATTKVGMAGFFADETSTDSVDEGDVGAARMTLTRKLIVNAQAHTAGGAIPFKNLDVDESEDAIKATTGQLYSLTMINLTNAVIYCKLYNDTVANVIVGTTVPVQVFAVPGNNDSDGAGISMNWPVGLLFDAAITIAATTGVADADVGAPAANALVVSGSYL